jgi:hypothetical protein
VGEVQGPGSLRRIMQKRGTAGLSDAEANEPGPAVRSRSLLPCHRWPAPVEHRYTERLAEAGASTRSALATPGGFYLDRRQVHVADASWSAAPGDVPPPRGLQSTPAHPDPGECSSWSLAQCWSATVRPVLPPAVCTEHQRVFTRQIDSNAATRSSPIFNLHG